MNIGMACRALRTDIRKYRLDMALRAHNSLVHAAERKTGPVVIKLRICADRFPAVGSMTIRARQVQRSVRASRLRVDLSLPQGRCTRWSPHQKQID